MKTRRTIGLMAFLKGRTDPRELIPGCANYDHNYGGCLFADKCKVQQGQRCSYFERAVLPTADDIGLGHEVRQLYMEKCGTEGEDGNKGMRACPDCGGALKPRQRYCDSCKEKRKIKTNIESARRYRKKGRANVIS